MTLIRVQILTTEHLSEIQNIGEESLGFSMAFRDGESAELPIAYDEFVKSPNGVIERVTGCDSYRMDISKSIDIGSSWQLPVYIAHQLAEQGMLANRWNRPDEIETEIFATGMVGYSGKVFVRPVEKVAEKLEWLDAYLSHGTNTKAYLILHRENLNDEMVRRFIERHPDLTAVAVDEDGDSVSVAIDSIMKSCRSSDTVSAVVSSGTPTNRRGFLYVGAAVVAIVGIVIAIAAHNISDVPMDNRSKEVGNPTVAAAAQFELVSRFIRLRRVPTGSKCSMLRFEPALAQIDEIFAETGTALELPIGPGYCDAALHLRLRSSAPTIIYAALFGRDSDGGTTEILRNEVMARPNGSDVLLPISDRLSSFVSIDVQLDPMRSIHADEGLASVQNQIGPSFSVRIVR